VWLGFKSLQEQQDEEEEEEARLAEEEEAQRLQASKGKKGAAAGKKQKKDQPPSPTAEPSDEESEGGSGGSGDEDEEGEGSEEGGVGEPSPYDLDPALGDLLQFLLSLPYVDEAWGIHDLILVREATQCMHRPHSFAHNFGAVLAVQDHELGANEEEEETEEEGSEDGEEYCLPCCQ